MWYEVSGLPKQDGLLINLIYAAWSDTYLNDPGEHNWLQTDRRIASIESLRRYLGFKSFWPIQCVPAMPGQTR